MAWGILSAGCAFCLSVPRLADLAFLPGPDRVQGFLALGAAEFHGAAFSACGPTDAVREDPLDVRVVVDRVRLVAGAEVKYLPFAAVPAAAVAEDVAPLAEERDRLPSRLRRAGRDDADELIEDQADHDDQVHPQKVQGERGHPGHLDARHKTPQVLE
jgi:hypothetical protein